MKSFELNVKFMYEIHGNCELSESFIYDVKSWGIVLFKVKISEMKNIVVFFPF